MPTRSLFENMNFEVFWLAYPRKVSKKAAQKAWDKLKPDEELAMKILESLERHKKTANWVKSMETSDMKYIPHAATWLNQERYEDELPKLGIPGPASRQNSRSTGHRGASNQTFDDCLLCSNLGRVVRKKYDGSTWAYRCKCGWGSLYKAYPDSQFAPPEEDLIADIEARPDVYTKGLQELAETGLLERMPLEVRKKIEEAITRGRKNTEQGEESTLHDMQV